MSFERAAPFDPMRLDRNLEPEKKGIIGKWQFLEPELTARQKDHSARIRLYPTSPSWSVCSMDVGSRGRVGARVGGGLDHGLSGDFTGGSSRFLPIRTEEVIRWLVEQDASDKLAWEQRLRRWIRAELAPRMSVRHS
jgi:hypothetical protein